MESCAETKWPPESATSPCWKWRIISRPCASESSGPSVEELEEVILDESRPERTTRMGTLASPTIRQNLAGFLRMNQDVFAWSHEDMPGINPSIIVHRLNVNPDSSPVRQKKTGVRVRAR